MELDDPTTLAILVADAFARCGAAHAVYGGLLVAAYGEPRETRDADFAVVDLRVAEAATALEAAGLETSVSFEDTRFGGLTISRLVVLGSADVSGLNTVDLVRPRSDRYARLSVSRAATAPLRGREIRVLAPEDFLIFKALSTRDRDIEDAAGVLRRSRDLVDLELIEAELSALASEISDFDFRARHDEACRRARGG